MGDYFNSMKNIDSNILKKAKNIDLLIFDVDGVLTDGGIYISESGNESKRFFAQDGHGIKIMQSKNIEVAILSGRYSKAVEVRGIELGIKKIIQSSKDKYLDYTKNFSKEYKSENVCFVGDDIVDIKLMKNVGLSITVPKSNYNGIQNIADWITPREGGFGAARDVCDLIYIAKYS
tara:strand:- start:441 stop:968 length:528 start_codon:yes stop_codon:yes gene_type:complete